MQVTNLFGEVITTEIKAEKGNNYNFIVEKSVNGQFKSGYPCKSHGQAIRISKKIIA